MILRDATYMLPNASIETPKTNKMKIEEIKCLNCSSDLTFWVSLRQSSPFRYRCPHYKTRYKVITPKMKLITFGVVILFLCLASTLIYGGGVRIKLPIWEMILYMESYLRNFEE